MVVMVVAFFCITAFGFFSAVADETVSVCVGYGCGFLVGQQMFFTDRFGQELAVCRFLIRHKGMTGIFCLFCQSGIFCIIGIGCDCSVCSFCLYKTVSAVVGVISHFAVKRSVKHISTFVIGHLFPIVSSKPVVLVIGHDCMTGCCICCSTDLYDIACAVIGVGIAVQEAAIRIFVRLCTQTVCFIIRIALFRTVCTLESRASALFIICISIYTAVRLCHGKQITALVIAVTDDLTARIGQADTVSKLIIAVAYSLSVCIRNGRDTV